MDDASGGRGVRRAVLARYRAESGDRIRHGRSAVGPDSRGIHPDLFGLDRASAFGDGGVQPRLRFYVGRTRRSAELAAPGFGTVDLQSARTAAEFTQIFSAWIARQHSATAGFSLGFDFLFIFLYVNAFYYSAIIAREAFANKGLARRAANY